MTNPETAKKMTTEERRIEESRRRTKHWKLWGPYVSERAWGTVREDYSPSGTAWDYFPHDHARSRAYRWNEDGLAGICDRHQMLCFAVALWNEKDPILKERLFGLTGEEGNHGEDVKEYFFYLDSTPTHSYMKFLYKYPQTEYPYGRLLDESRRRSKADPEFELLDSGVFDQNRYFDVFVEYAKADVEDICIRITIANRGPEKARLRLLPTLWFRNTWSWGMDSRRPLAEADDRFKTFSAIRAHVDELGDRWLYCQDSPELLFTENETNFRRLFNGENRTLYVKDAFHEYVIHGKKEAINPEQRGTKAAAHYQLELPAGQSVEIRLRLSAKRYDASSAPLGLDFEEVFAQRKQEADEFYQTVVPQDTSADTANVMRQAFAGVLWCKQFYNYEV